MKRLVYATTNPGKFQEVKKIFSAHDLTLHSPSEYNLNIDVEETGKTLEENAKLKAQAYLEHLPVGCIVIGDDTGLEIDALGGEPGIKVRRWKGHRMTDEEIINYTLERMAEVPVGERGAQFRTVLAIAAGNLETKIFDGIFRVSILDQALASRTPGFPFRSLIKVIEPTHRVHAVISALPYLKNLLGQSSHTPGV